MKKFQAILLKTRALLASSLNLHPGCEIVRTEGRLGGVVRTRLPSLSSVRAPTVGNRAEAPTRALPMEV